MTKSSNSPASTPASRSESSSAPRPWTWRRRLKIRLFTAARRIVVPTLRMTIGLRLEGIENVPMHGGGLVVANHLHNLEPFLFVCAFPRPVLFMAKKEAFAVPLLGRFIRFCGAFPVDRGAADRGALRNAERLLAEGMLVGIFPEGTRSFTGGLKEPFPGVGMIAVRSGAPIIPAAIFGAEALPFNGSRGQRKRTGPLQVTVRFGKPYQLPERKPGEPRPSLEEITDLMMVEIARLLPEQYRGIYAERVAESEDADSTLTPVR